MMLQRLAIGVIEIMLFLAIAILAMWALFMVRALFIDIKKQWLKRRIRRELELQRKLRAELRARGVKKYEKSA